MSLKLTKFIIVSKDSSGYGFCEMLLNESDGRGKSREELHNEVIFSLIPKEDEECLEELERVGDGVVEKILFEELFKNRKQYKDWAWIWDGNHNSDKSEQLRKEGFIVFGGLELSDKMEHDRDFGISLIEKIGLPLPDYKVFKTKDEGLNFLEDNQDIAYVFKPDSPDDKSWVTTCPDHDNDIKANGEIYNFLKSQPEGMGEYLLQERKKGVEINVEIFMYNGSPFFAQVNFEAKRKYSGDYGKMIGCAFDTCFAVPLDCKIIKETLIKLSELPEFSDYTGFLDMNLIVADNEYWFLEFCGRFGYNAHPNLFLSIAISPFSEIMSDWILGNIDNFDRHFRKGYGASITLWIDEPVMGLPLSFDDETEISRFFSFDTYYDGEYYLAGYANEVGIIVAHDYDLKSACEEAVAKFKRIHYPGKTGRLDLVETNYLSNPIERLQACREMGLFEK